MRGVRREAGGGRRSLRGREEILHRFNIDWNVEGEKVGKKLNSGGQRAEVGKMETKLQNEIFLFAFFPSLSLFFCLSCSSALVLLLRTATSKSSGGFATTLFYSQHNPDISVCVCAREREREKGRRERGKGERIWG